LSGNSSPPAVLRVLLLDRNEIANILDAVESGDQEALRRSLQVGDFCEAVEVAAPDLGRQIERLLTTGLHHKKRDRFCRGIYRYGMRALSRPTPYGLFSGVAIDRGAAVGVDLDGRHGFCRHARPSASWVQGVCDDVRANVEARAELRVVANRAIFDDGGRLVVECSTRPDVQGAVITKNVPLIRDILALCDGWTSGPDVIEFVESAAGVRSEIASAYVDDLVGNGLLLTELDAVQKAFNPFDGLLTVVRDVRRRTGRPSEYWTGLDSSLHGVVAALAAVDASSSNGRSVYRRALSSMAAVTGARADLHVDAVGHPTTVRQVRAASCPVPDGAAERAVDVMRTIFPAVHHRDVLTVKRWIERHYGSDHFVPLGEVFVPGCGVELSDGADVRRAPTEGAQPGIDLHQLVGEPDVDAEAAVTTPRRQADPATERPLSIALLRYRTARDRRQWVELNMVAASVAILGRFGGLDDRILQTCRDFIQRQEESDDPTILRAEVHGLYRGRAQNVAVRHLLRRFCIDLGPPTRGVNAFGRDVTSLPLDDLVLRVRGDMVELHSRSLSRRVLPSVTNAVRPQMAVDPLLRFLQALSGEVNGSAQWSWGPLDRVPMLPRVTCRDIVLSPRQWRLPVDGLRAALRKDRIPRFVEVRKGRMTEVHDLGSRYGMAEVDRCALNDGTVIVREIGLDDCPPSETTTFERVSVIEPCGARRGAQGPPEDARRPVPTTSIVEAPPDARHFGPGSTWMSLRMYISRDQMNTLIKIVAGCLDRCATDGDPPRWFFVRYADDDPYLRVRVQGADRSWLWGHVLPRLSEAVTTWRPSISVVVDRYTRELDRYGGLAGIAACERWFCADSTYVAATLDDDEADQVDRAAWEIDTLYDLAGLSTSARRSFAHRCEASRAGAATRAAIDEAGRRYRAARGATGGVGVSAPPPSHPGVTNWRANGTTLLARLRHDLGATSEEYGSVVRSLVHMHCNRLFPHDANYWEALCNSLLRRRYDSVLSVAGLPTAPVAHSSL
jgi:lantibiotic biosynthesis protein